MPDDYITAGSLVDGRFAVGPTIGAGSFGIVYRAEDNRPGDGARFVALKTLRPEAFGIPDLVERFAREADISASLVHPNIVTLVTHGTVEMSQRPVPYMAMELIRGLPLGGVISLRGRLSIPETTHILSSVLEGLQVAHMQGIVHRDLKPNNILMAAPEDMLSEPGEGADLFKRLGVPSADQEVWRDLVPLNVKVVDFGLGKMLETGGKRVKRLTRAGVAAGTAEYMSPEQVRAVDDVDHRADIYGVAMLIYRLLSGRSAFAGKNPVEVAKMQLFDALPPLPGALADHRIAQVYAKAGSKERDERYDTALEMAYELRRAVDPEAFADRPDFDKPPKVRPQRGWLSRLFRR